VLNRELAKNAPFENAIDVFKYRGKSYEKDLEDPMRFIPADAIDYVHACRFPSSVIARESFEMFGYNYPIEAASHIVGATKKNIRRGIKDKFCIPRATRLRDPDMVCASRKGTTPECMYLEINNYESQAETGAKHSWVHPNPIVKTNKGVDMIPQPWRDAIFSD